MFFRNSFIKRAIPDLFCYIFICSIRLQSTVKKWQTKYASGIGSNHCVSWTTTRTIGCGSAGRVVCSKPEVPSSNLVIGKFLIIIVTVNSWKDENKEKRGRECPICRKNILGLALWEHIKSKIKSQCFHKSFSDTKPFSFPKVIEPL